MKPSARKVKKVWSEDAGCNSLGNGSWLCIGFPGKGAIKSPHKHIYDWCEICDDNWKKCEAKYPVCKCGAKKP